MSCQETREKLSALADNELGGEERERVRGHLAGCSTCRRELQDQGALDMLLKSCFVKEPSDASLESIWPTVSERLDEGEEGRAGNGGGTLRDHGEIVFKSSSAMQMLRIPEVAVAEPPKGPTAPPPARSGWAWPVALVVSAAILAGGFVLYKRMTPVTPPSSETAAPAAPAAGAAVKVAMAEPGEEPAASSAASQPAGEPSAAEPEEGPAAPGAQRKAGKGKRGRPTRLAAARSPAEDQQPEKGSEKAEKAEAKPAAAPRPAAKGDELDSLIDGAISSGPPAAARKKQAEPPAAAKASGEELPEQLNMNQIRGAMNKIKGHVQACYDKYQIEGEARVSFTISPDGSVAECSIKGKFFGTDTGSCVVAAVKRARFPKFSGKAMTIANYPFLLQ